MFHVINGFLTIALAVFVYGVGLPAQAAAEAPVHRSVGVAFDRSGEPQKLWLYLKDKGFADRESRDQAVAELLGAYDVRAVRRRLLRGDAARENRPVFTERDLPVARRYAARIEATGARIANESRWLNAVSVWASREQTVQLAKLPFVDRVEPVRRGRRIESPGEYGMTLPAAGAGPFHGLATDQLTLINLIRLHDRGFTGEGVVVGVLDTGFSRIHEAFSHPQRPLNVIAEYDFVNGDPNAAIEEGDPVSQHSHGTWILGVLGAYKPGELIGGAYGASFILCKTEDTTQEVPVEEDGYAAGLEFIEMHGGDVATSSLGYIAFYDYADLDGLTAVTTQAVNIATSHGVFCVTAAGNRGRFQDNPGLMAPGDAFDVITVGAVTLGGILTDFSSNGPSADGRLKPEVLALGQDASSISDSAATGYNSNLDGTSLSTPMVASAVACLLQAHPDWTVSQMRRNLFETSSDYMQAGQPDPESARGYGVINSYRAWQDCNANNQADFIDVFEGAVDDNGNFVPDACETFGDLDADGDVDLLDYADFVTCATSPNEMPDPIGLTVNDCLAAFSGTGGDVDLGSFAAFQNAFGGSAP